MSKAILVCFREGEPSSEFRTKLELLNQRLSPDNITSPPPLIINNNGILIAIFNPNKALSIKHTSVCLGNMIAPSENWSEPIAEAPDGTYALFRSDDNAVELVADIVASRTIWYIQTEEMFLAATSQRAIVSLLGDFQLNRVTVSWMLSAGMLGPDNSWDQRIKPVGSDSRVLLDRASWKLTVHREDGDFTPLDLPVAEHKKRLKQALEETFAHLQLDYSKWILPLSGGFDSRAALIMLLQNQRKIRSVTWGLQPSLNDELNDAYIAKALAEHFNLEHRYLEINISDEPIETIVNRYLVAGEGRIDHIRAYMDGFKVWKLLFEEGNVGVIRGDQGFPSNPAYTSFRLKQYNGLSFLSDYANLKDFNEFDLVKQTIPEYLQRKSGESLVGWRDRLYHQIRIAMYFAALNDLKCAYVEIINPLLSRRVIKQVRTIPPALKTDKKLFKELVHEIGPDIRFAKREATASRRSVEQNRSMTDFILSELNSTYAEAIFSKRFVNFINQNMKILTENSIPKRSKKQLLPQKLIRKVKSALTKPDVAINTLALRALIVCKMSQILYEDAESLKNVSIKPEEYFAPHPNL